MDLADVEKGELIKILQGCDTLFHLAAVKLHNTANSFESIVANNVVATNKLFEAAGEAGVKNIIFSSSLYSYGLPLAKAFNEETLTMPTTSYGASKLFGESLLRLNSDKFGFHYSIARLFFIYGEKQFALGGYKSVVIGNFERLKSGLPALVNGDGQQVLDYLYVDDCVDALICLMESKINDVVNISSGQPVRILDLTNRMMEIAGCQKFEFVDPDWTHGTRRVGDRSKMETLTGWMPRVSLSEGLSRTWESLN
jgi:UDP-glucose 4-epimerase